MPRVPVKTCAVDGCDKPSRRWGMCNLHSSRFFYHGDPLRGPLTKEELFWQKVRKGPGCWEWTAVKNRQGYGQFNYRGSMRGAHRVIYEMLHGPIPKGMHVCHSCDNPSCVRPDHLWLGTRSDNMRDAFRKGRKTVTPPDNRGERCGKAKLTNEAVREIRKRHGNGEMQKDLAAEYGVDRSSISRIVRGEAWAHID